ncbi:MAG: formate dehydrogenase accessory protein FdhE [Sutterellaceae bacterium]|nr:formate dehydrogenase accessory protein FdhE [Burkholderiaceae bacterium]MCX7901492.1 formate dehydrogenase accessory protein FdhE [Burkholderiaceae bacterium]MDW8430074.1 formate dehydrogenase accessory protein FdhE [Sutterellaceae bacterium]
MPTRIITDGSTERVVPAPRVVLPAAATLFAERAARFAQLSQGHPFGAYLQLMARVAQAQHEACAARPALPTSASLLAASREYGMPPLAALSHERAALWREDLAAIVQSLRPRASAELAAALQTLAGADASELEALADRVLAGNATDADAPLVPLVGAALQVYFTRQAAALPVDDVSRCDVATVCPVCGTRPVASVVRLGGAQANLRYLVCALCSTEWNMVRAKCSVCEAEKSVGYLSIEQEGRSLADVPIRAETCDECHSYLKIFYQEKDPLLEPMADDLASLALDLLVDERGYARSGPNLLLHPGSS